MAPELRSEAYLKYHVQVFKRGMGRPIEAPPPYLPHGQRDTGWIEPETPVPRCADCRDEIYYDRRTDTWQHQLHTEARNHEAVPETLP